MSLEDQIKETLDGIDADSTAEERAGIMESINEALGDIPAEDRGLFKLMIATTIAALALSDPELSKEEEQRVILALKVAGTLLHLEITKR